MDPILIYALTKNDFTVETLCPAKKGGQHSGLIDPGIRISHHVSEATCICREHRSHHSNRGEAFSKLIKSEKFLLWHKIKCKRIMGGHRYSNDDVCILSDPRTLDVEVLISVTE